MTRDPTGPIVIRHAGVDGEPAVIVRPVDNVVKMLGAALVVAVLMLVYVMWRQGDSLDAFTAQQMRGDAVAACRTRAGADVERVITEADRRARASLAAGLRLLIMSSDLREHRPTSPDDPRIAQVAQLENDITTNANAAAVYDPRVKQLGELRTGSPAACEADPNYQLPRELLVFEP